MTSRSTPFYGDAPVGNAISFEYVRTKKETERRQDRLLVTRQYVQSAYAVRTCTETEQFKHE